MTERTSSFFRYTEEYVLDHSLPWIRRKFKQANREEYEQQQLSSGSVMRGMLAALSQAFGGKDSEVDKIMLPPYEEFVKKYQNNQQENGDWVTSQWWKRSSK